MLLTLLIGVSYAADKITLTCSDGEDDYSLSLDLDKKLAIFDMHSDLAVDIPIVRVTDTSIWFQKRPFSDIYWEGTLTESWMAAPLSSFFRPGNGRSVPVQASEATLLVPSEGAHPD